MKMVIAALAIAVCVGCSASQPPASRATSSPQSSATPEAASSVRLPGQPPVAGPSPLPVGAAVARQVLSPAKVMPAVALCTLPIQTYQDGNGGPLFCRGGAINVGAWKYFAPIDPHVMALGPSAGVSDVETAIRADFGVHSTNVLEDSGYQLAAAYYGWKLAFDFWNFIYNGG